MCLERGKGAERQQKSTQAVIDHDHARAQHNSSPVGDLFLRDVLYGLRHDGFFRFNRSWAFGQLFG